MTSVLASLDALDTRLYARAARREDPVLDRVLPPLTSAADHGLLWLAVAGVLALSGGRRRRAAVRGVASLGVASLVANVPGKRAARRARPQLHPVPLPRRLLRQPTSTSFPSGHSASAAAFAVGVGLESHGAALPVGLLAAGVAYGRVHTGVHYPGDVAAGVLLGAGAAVAVRRAWPVSPDRPAVGRVAVEAPALPDGDGLVVVVNMASGSSDLADEVEACLAEQLPKARLVRATDVTEDLRAAAREARVLGVMGGDGTVNAAAGIALEAGLPLAVLPGGTLNHFAGELGIAGVQEVARAVREGTAVRVSVGTAAPDGKSLYFLNTFALGVYPELVRERERHEERLGKWPAMALAMVRVLRTARPLELDVDGTPRRLWTLFAGNGHYHPAGFAPSWRERMDDGAVDVRLVDAEAPLARTRLVLAVLTGRLGRSAVHEQRIVGRLPVRSTGGPLRPALDGEVVDGPAELLLRAATTPLVVYRPEQV